MEGEFVQRKKYCNYNNFFTCPICMGDHFRVSFRAYLSDDVEGNPATDFAFSWNEESVVSLFFDCKCLRCGFIYKTKKVLPLDFIIDDLDDSYDFIVDYFKNLKNLKFNNDCLEYMINSMSKTPRYRMTESQTTLKDFIKEAKK